MQDINCNLVSAGISPSLSGIVCLQYVELQELK
jgi:hypothetical protein